MFVEEFSLAKQGRWGRGPRQIVAGKSSEKTVGVVGVHMEVPKLAVQGEDKKVVNKERRGNLRLILFMGNTS